MVDYEKLYKILFNGITDAVECLENQNTCAAAKTLISVQRETEALYVLAGEHKQQTVTFVKGHAGIIRRRRI